MRVLLSVKPEFADLIFSKTKKYEYRRVIFKNEDIKEVVVYVSSPVKMIIGEIKIDKIICDKPDAIWKRTQKYSGVNKKFFFSYFYKRQIGYAIKIKSAYLYEEPIDPYKSIKNFRPPQSFAYLKDELSL